MHKLDELLQKSKPIEPKHFFLLFSTHFIANSENICIFAADSQQSCSTLESERVHSFLTDKTVHAEPREAMPSLPRRAFGWENRESRHIKKAFT